MPQRVTKPAVAADAPIRGTATMAVSSAAAAAMASASRRLVPAQPAGAGLDWCIGEAPPGVQTPNRCTGPDRSLGARDRCGTGDSLWPCPATAPGLTV